MLSRELLSLLRLTSLLSTSPGGISPLVARRFEIYIAKKNIAQAGQLADFMADVVESTYEEKLRVLSSLKLRDRLVQVIELLRRQVAGFKNNIKVTTLATTPSFGQGIGGMDINQMDPRQREAIARRAMSGLAPPPGFGGGRGEMDDDKEHNEIDELQHRLQDAQLSPEAQKVAVRELRRLKKMNPANAEYGVTRTYLENLAEIPWTKVSEDQM
ncbi:hypothetical protein KEM55_000203, partial [Ascosphaera atra]